MSNYCQDLEEDKKNSQDATVGNDFLFSQTNLESLQGGGFKLTVLFEPYF